MDCCVNCCIVGFCFCCVCYCEIVGYVYIVFEEWLDFVCVGFVCDDVKVGGVIEILGDVVL